MTTKGKRQITLDTEDGYRLIQRKAGWTVRGITMDTAGRQFSVRETKPGQWLVTSTSSDGGRVRPTIHCEGVAAAVALASERLYGATHSDPEEFRLGAVFASWQSTLTVRPVTLAGYDYGVEAFLQWLERQPGAVRYWGDLRRMHLERYLADLNRRGCAQTYMAKLVQPVFQCIRWASRNWPELFHNVADGLSVKKACSQPLERNTTALTLEQVGRLLVTLWEAEDFPVLPGVALQGICSLRLQEAFRCTWDMVDFTEGLLMVPGTKNDHSRRTIPLPRLVLEVLEFTRNRAEENTLLRLNDENLEKNEVCHHMTPLLTSQKILSAFNTDFRNYGKGLHRRLRKYLPGVQIEPKGLRRTLANEAWRGGWHGDLTEIYRGHRPHTLSEVDRRHYVVFDPTQLIDRMRESVVTRIDAALESFEGFTHGAQKPPKSQLADVIPLHQVS